MPSSWLCLHFFHPQKLRNELAQFLLNPRNETYISESRTALLSSPETYAMLSSLFANMLALLISIPFLSTLGTKVLTNYFSIPAMKHTYLT